MLISVQKLHMYLCKSKKFLHGRKMQYVILQLCNSLNQPPSSFLKASSNCENSRRLIVALSFSIEDVWRGFELHNSPLRHEFPQPNCKLRDAFYADVRNNPREITGPLNEDVRISDEGDHKKYGAQPTQAVFLHRNGN